MGDAFQGAMQFSVIFGEGSAAVDVSGSAGAARDGFERDGFAFERSMAARKCIDISGWVEELRATGAIGFHSGEFLYHFQHEESTVVERMGAAGEMVHVGE